MRDSIIIERNIKAPIDQVFKALVRPEELVKWHHAGDGWFTPHANVDPKVGGKISIGYSSADGAQSFEFGAIISEYDPPKRLAYYLQLKEPIKKESRLVTYDLSENNDITHLRLEFDIEHVNDKELQRKGWTEHIDNLENLLRK